MQPPHILRWQHLPGNAPDGDRWRICEADTIAEVEEILDLLETSGIAERQFLLIQDKFIVRWRPPFEAVTVSR